MELELARTEYRRREVEKLVTTQRLQELCSNQVPGCLVELATNLREV